jgi:tRNA(Ile2) C34 agmatinyltransferase TiaS
MTPKEKAEELIGKAKIMFMSKAKKLNLGSVSKPVCPTCGSKGYKTTLTDNSYACKKCLTWWVNGC